MEQITFEIGTKSLPCRVCVRARAHATERTTAKQNGKLLFVFLFRLCLHWNIRIV